MQDAAAESDVPVTRISLLRKWKIHRYFLRLKVEDRCGVLAEMTAIFAKYQVSVAQIIQKDTKVEGCAEVVVITEKVREGDFRTAIEELRNRDSVRKISTIIRVYGK